MLALCLSQPAVIINRTSIYFSFKMKKLIIGVSGASGSGNSIWISVDEHYKNQLPTVISPLDNKAYEDWNSPESIDVSSFMTAFEKAIKGKEDTIIIDGAFIYCIPEICDLIDFKVFVDATIEMRIFRRIKRNLNYNQPPAAVAESLNEIGMYYLACARYSEAKYSVKSKEYADFIVDSETGFDETQINNLVSKISQIKQDR